MKKKKKETKPPKLLFERFIAYLSTGIGYSIIFTSASTYVTQAVTKPFEVVAPIALTAFGLIGALSAICYTAVPIYSDNAKSTFKYAGEKFFHSALLILQSILLKYVVDQAQNIKWISEYLSGWNPLTILLTLIFGFVSAYSAYFAFYGFEDINQLLWENYKDRRRFWKMKKDENSKKSDEDSNTNPPVTPSQSPPESS